MCNRCVKEWYVSPLGKTKINSQAWRLQNGRALKKDQEEDQHQYGSDKCMDIGQHPIKKLHEKRGRTPKKEKEKIGREKCKDKKQVLRNSQFDAGNATLGCKLGN